ncbi:LysR substrate-binding domain-containing protein [Celerinatantimonas sp. YJH-8]|uniref:LysR substrate-binding domain-containing protein n=1 Tax=Celerinatantimonas sp. YJH-8 TaxID=3228714 RepID=UPI0038C993A8
MMKRHTLPLTALRAFEVAARLGKMTDAADELCVSHSAISRQVRGLETLLGVRLFEGPRHQLKLSPSAEKLLPKLTLAFDILEDALNSITVTPSQVIDVSCLGTLSMRWLIPQLYEFQDSHPDIEIRLTTDDGAVDWNRDHIDVAIRVAEHFDQRHQVIPLFADFVGPVLSPELITSSHQPSLHQLLQLPLLHTRTRITAWNDWLSQRDESTTVSTYGKVFEHFYFMLEAAISGLGVAIAPYILVKNDIRSGRLIAPFGFSGNHLNYAALTMPSPTEPVRQFTSWLKKIADTEQTPPSQ